MLAFLTCPNSTGASHLQPSWSNPSVTPLLQLMSMYRFWVLQLPHDLCRSVPRFPMKPAQCRKEHAVIACGAMQRDHDAEISCQTISKNSAIGGRPGLYGFLIGTYGWHRAMRTNREDAPHLRSPLRPLVLCGSETSDDFSNMASPIVPVVRNGAKFLI